MLGRAIAVVLLLCAGACSSAPSYQKQVTELSTGFAKVKSSFDTLVEEERQAFIEAQTAKGLTAQNKIILPPECQRDAAPAPCNLEIVEVSAGRTTALRYKSAVPNGSKLAASLASYGESLTTLAGAKDVAELRDATAKAIAAIVKLAVESKLVPAEPLTSFASFGGWVAGQYLEHRRFEALREAVRSADPVVASAASLLARQALLLSRSVIRQRATTQQLDVVQLAKLRHDKPNEPASHRKAADAAIANNIALQTLLKADATQPFAKMREAHAELLESLENPELTPAAVFAKISEFLDQIETLKSGLEKARGAKS